MLSAAPLLAGGAASAATNDFNGGAVTNCSLAPATKTYTCGALSLPDFNSSTAIASGYTVMVSSALAFGFNQGLQMSGSARLQASDLDIGDIKPALLNITGGTLAADNTFTIGDQAQTIVANVTAPTINVGSGSSTQITGTLTATNQIVLASNVTVIGNLDAPTVRLKASSTSVKGNINATTALTIESGNTVNGNITGGALTMDSAGVVVNGNVTMTGDVSIGSSGTINGDLKARNVVTHASGDYISGNAAVNAIYLDFGATVGKTITCTGSGASGCSCVTRADSKYNPTCGAPPPAGIDHIQITHSGNALTCQQQTVALKACADSSCATVYNGSVTVALSPGGGNVTFSGSANATVRQSSATPAGNPGTVLSAVSGIAANPTVCPNSGTGTNDCHMRFSDNGLEISAPDHVSMTPQINLTVQALKAGPGGGSCVPLVTGQNVAVNFSCKYMNPTPAVAASTPVMIGGQPVSCGGAATPVALSFDSNGLATPSLAYAEVGQVGLSATYLGAGANANLGASGGDDFVAAPAAFRIRAKRLSGTLTTTTKVFGNPGDAFTVSVSAVNASAKDTDADSANVTTNFGKESSPEYFTYDELLKFPSGGLNPIVKGGFAAIAGGVGNSIGGPDGQWKFSEVGTITITANGTSASKSGYYMNVARNDFATKGAADLRFVPNHFDTALVSGIPMACTKVGGGLGNPCSPDNSNGGFVYSKQGFQLKITAYNDATSNAAAISQNYVDKVAADTDKVAQDITLSTWSAAGGSTAVSVTGGGLTPSVPFSFVKGVGQATSTLPVFEFKFGALPDTPTVPTTMFIRATDTDNVTSKRIGAIEAPLTVVSGLMTVVPGHGSENTAMPLTAQAMYYSAAKSYVFNSQFSPVKPAVGADVTIGANINYMHCQKQLDTTNNNGHICAAPGPTSIWKVLDPGTLNFQNGKAIFRLAAPRLSGSVDVQLEPMGWTDTMPSPIIYLPNPAAGRQTFGVYRSGPVIYTREVHN